MLCTLFWAININCLSNPVSCLLFCPTSDMHRTPPDSEQLLSLDVSWKEKVWVGFLGLLIASNTTDCFSGWDRMLSCSTLPSPGLMNGLALRKEGLSWRENWLRIGGQLCTWLTPRLSLAYSSACQRSLISRQAAFPKTKGVNAILNTQTREKHFELFCWVISTLIYIQFVKFSSGWLVSAFSRRTSVVRKIPRKTKRILIGTLDSRRHMRWSG